MIDPNNYTNHTGGALGADLAWDEIGRKYGVTNHIHYRPEDYDMVSPEDKVRIDKAFELAANTLKRPVNFKGNKLPKRNWFQVHNADAIFAIGYLVWPNEKDIKGYVNYADKAIVSGGTGWAVEMAIQMGKPIFVFDQAQERWYKYNYVDNSYYVYGGVPELTEHFAGIGSRELTPEGEASIDDVYFKTFRK